MENKSKKWISTFYLERLNNKLSMAAAGIHATIISILIGVSIAYFLHINSQLNEVETAAIEIAERVNEIQFSPIWLSLVGPGHEFLEKWSSEEEQIPLLLTAFWREPIARLTLERSMNNPPLKIYFSEIGLNDTEFKLCLMGVLTLKYPFPDRMVMKDDVLRGMQPSPFIVFSKMYEIVRWTATVTQLFHPIVNHINWFGKESFIQGFDWTKEINISDKFLKKETGRYNAKDVTEFKKIPDEFCANVLGIFKISRKLEYKLKRYQYLQQLSPHKAHVVLLLALSVVAFLSGIIIPILTQSANKLLIVYIPVVYYSYFMSYLLYKILRFVF